MEFTVPYSSSPPSTPGTKFGAKRATAFGSVATNVSTTPSGPPPSSAASFTPAGPPPSSVFGSSRLGSGVDAFSTKPFGSQKWSQPKPFADLQFPSSQTGASRANDPASLGFNIGQSTNSFEDDGLAVEYDESEQYEDDDDAEGSEDYEDDDGMDVDREYADEADDREPILYFNGAKSRTSTSVGINDGTTYNALRSSKRSTGPSSVPDQAARKPKDSAVSEIARSLAARRDNALLDEPDDLILTTEDIVSMIYVEAYDKDWRDVEVQISLSKATQGLISNWKTHSDTDELSEDAEEDNVGIGPGDSASPIAKATFMSSLLLQLHHPPVIAGKVTSSLTQADRRSFATRHQPKLESIPKVLLDWLEGNHDPLGDVAGALLQHRPNATAHLNYWDIITGLALRGRLNDVLRVFQESDFKHARSSLEDGQSQAGYFGAQIQSISKVLGRATQILSSCPGVSSNDWDITGRDWLLFRKRAEAALDELVFTAEGPNQPSGNIGTDFQAENFGISTTQPSVLSISQSTRRASSKVPWTVYQNLKVLYTILLGRSTDILSYAQDWIEACIALTAWWNGEDDDDIAFDGSMSQHHQSKHIQAPTPRSVDLDPQAAYIRRLGYAFERITERDTTAAFQINSMNPTEVGLASVFENDVEAVLGLLQSWSLPIAASVAEMATLGGWLQASTGTDLMGEFNESDLIVLGSLNNEKKISKDSLLDAYTTALFMRDPLTSRDRLTVREGWELAFEILPRFNDRKQLEFKARDFLKEFNIDSREIADKLMHALDALGLEQASQMVSEKFSDWIAETSQSYGAAILGYARAHNYKKIKGVLDLLISYCIVQSTSYPSVANLDQDLLDLLQHPKEVLKRVYDSDPQSGEMLRYYLSGYATLRRFYDLRDEELLVGSGQEPKHQPLTRKKLAAEALLAVINSAGHSISGGLYDESRDSVVQIDGLMALLGEALMFVNEPKRSLTNEQIFSLLQAIEDLQTVNTLVYEACEECFQAAIRNAHGSEPPSLKAMFKKTQSSLSASTFSFSMIGSQMLESGPSTRSMGSSGVMVKGEIKRGWDWRTVVPSHAKGAEILKQLRLGLAKQLAAAWAD